MTATINPASAAAIPDTFTNLAPSGMTSQPPLTDPGLAEAATLTGDMAGAIPTVTLTGVGGPKGQYRLKVAVVDWRGASSITLTGAKSGLVAAFGPKGQLGDITRPLAADTYTWAYSGGTGPAGVALTIQGV